MPPSPSWDLISYRPLIFFMRDRAAYGSSQSCRAFRCPDSVSAGRRGSRQPKLEYGTQYRNLTMVEPVLHQAGGLGQLQANATNKINVDGSEGERRRTHPSKGRVGADAQCVGPSVLSFE